MSRAGRASGLVGAALSKKPPSRLYYVLRTYRWFARREWNRSRIIASPTYFSTCRWLLHRPRIVQTYAHGWQGGVTEDHWPEPRIWERAYAWAKYLLRTSILSTEYHLSLPLLLSYLYK